MFKLNLKIVSALCFTTFVMCVGFWYKGRINKTHQEYPASSKSSQFFTKVIYNRVGKCGSRSLNSVILQLKNVHGFNFHKSKVTNVTRPKVLQLKAEVQFIENLQPPFLYSRHIHFINFEKFGVKPPVYINMIRDPIERFQSQYYFRRYGDKNKAGPRLAQHLLKKQTGMSINECVLSDHFECTGLKLWYIIPYFCGQSVMCRQPGKAALERAKRHLLDHYLVVGMLEDFEGLLQVLEKLVPEFFVGAMDMWRKISDSKEGMKTLYKEPLNPEAYTHLRDQMQLEYEFYEFAVGIFKQLKNFQLGL